MKKHNITIGLSVLFLSLLPSLVIAEAVPTMNQPDNGFFEGPNPEFAALHSTDLRGTVEHRQFHRDAVQALRLWLEQNRSKEGTLAYNDTYRLFHKERIDAHRLFHTSPAVSDDSQANRFMFNESVSLTNTTNEPNLALNTDASILFNQMNGGRPSRRSIIAMAEYQNTLRLALR